MREHLPHKAALPYSFKSINAYTDPLKGQYISIEAVQLPII